MLKMPASHCGEGNRRAARTDSPGKSIRPSTSREPSGSSAMRRGLTLAVFLRALFRPHLNRNVKGETACSLASMVKPQKSKGPGRLPPRYPQLLFRTAWPEGVVRGTWATELKEAFIHCPGRQVLLYTPRPGSASPRPGPATGT